MKAISAFLVFLVVLTLPFLVSAANGGLLSAGALVPEVQKPQNSSECVEDTAYMRANHMNILKVERENAVRDGVRNEKHSLKNCFTCHTSKSEFCDKCHAYAGVQPSCFSDVGGCHSAPK